MGSEITEGPDEMLWSLGCLGCGVRGVMVSGDVRKCGKL